MAARYHRTLFIFRRDLRLDDNTGLIAALKCSQEVIPAFIFDSRQVGATNRHRNEFGIRFMLESLDDLERQLRYKGARLYRLGGLPHEVVGRLAREHAVDAVFVNRDYTPFSRRRDAELARRCQEFGIPFRQYADALLTEPEAVLKQDGTPYTVFTPFYRAAGKLAVSGPKRNRYTNYFTDTLKDNAATDPAVKPALNRSIRGGRSEGLKLLKLISELSDYCVVRDIPSLKGTSGLSPHNKFGTVSIREVHQAVLSNLGPDHDLIRQLYWRDFFTHIAFHFPHVLGQNFRGRYTNIAWNRNQAAFRRWCDGLTGFPIIDAGMRQLNKTGQMHSRIRMIVASFLVKDLHIDWRRGEEYFAQRLVDYDPAVNNGNWQWVASTGCDAVPYFRIFNPWIQQRKFDPDALYMKKWVPEVREVPAAQLHRWYLSDSQGSGGYPKPMIDHDIESKIAKQMFGNAVEAKGIRE